ncbi:hypothetical protein SAMN06265375_10566 [Muriicola jejuensis]|uniref:Uncharacterized protein n=1 Tax=Muriicola jejuensis TaxID=504488 RepID=A0A6P0UF95_9FLAO|nr:hypothetical protein [Muriicola jejuensis]NER11687.1 hypothetical protein [Muriicola jejuensis]SMP25435.1 hypothetical protein SAMN06265375_10566 [Muriicola jejuensis]
MTSAALLITAAFGLFLIAVGFVMLLFPRVAWNILKKAGSTPLINYGELTLRMIPAAGLILYAGESRFPMVFEWLGWFMIGSSLVLMLLPRRWHHAYALRCAALLPPPVIRLISPFSFAFGGFILYAVL